MCFDVGLRFGRERIEFCGVALAVPNAQLYTPKALPQQRPIVVVLDAGSGRGGGEDAEYICRTLFRLPLMLAQTTAAAASPRCDFVCAKMLDNKKAASRKSYSPPPTRSARLQKKCVAAGAH